MNPGASRFGDFNGIFLTIHGHGKPEINIAISEYMYWYQWVLNEFTISRT